MYIFVVSALCRSLSCQLDEFFFFVGVYVHFFIVRSFKFVFSHQITLYPSWLQSVHLFGQQLANLNCNFHFFFALWRSQFGQPFDTLLRLLRYSFSSASVWHLITAVFGVNLACMQLHQVCCIRIFFCLSDNQRGKNTHTRYIYYFIRFRWCVCLLRNDVRVRQQRIRTHIFDREQRNTIMTREPARAHHRSEIESVRLMRMIAKTPTKTEKKNRTNINWKQPSTFVSEKSPAD